MEFPSLLLANLVNVEMNGESLIGITFYRGKDFGRIFLSVSKFCYLVVGEIYLMIPFFELFEKIPLNFW